MHGIPLPGRACLYIYFWAQPFVEKRTQVYPLSGAIPHQKLIPFLRACCHGSLRPETVFREAYPVFRYTWSKRIHFLIRNEVTLFRVSTKWIRFAPKTGYALRHELNTFCAREGMRPAPKSGYLLRARSGYVDVRGSGHTSVREACVSSKNITELPALIRY